MLHEPSLVDPKVNKNEKVTLKGTKYNLLLLHLQVSSLLFSTLR